jgi:hypothetical protein
MLRLMVDSNRAGEEELYTQFYEHSICMTASFSARRRSPMIQKNDVQLQYERIALRDIRTT